MSTSEPQQPSKPAIGAGCFFALFFGGILLVVVLFGAIFGSDSGDEPSPTEHLCDLLRGGWTSGQLINNDVWQEWPDTQSPLSRTSELIKAADRGGCVNLT